MPPPATVENSPPKQVKFTNLKKIFWPDEGYTKGDLIEYYRTIAPFLLPYLKDRPLVLTRYPDGIAGKSFFQKDAPEFVPSWVRREKIYSKDTHRDIGYIIVNDLETLLYVINMGTIPLHLWSSRIDSLERPDWLVLDLDPKGAPFAHVVKVARALHEILTKLRLESFIKTSGASGLHILLPLGARYTHEQAKNFARLLAILGTESVPDISTIARPIAARGGKVYIDFGQNGYGVTIAAPFAVRPLPGATVSCPLALGRGQRAAASVALHDQDCAGALPEDERPHGAHFSQGNRFSVGSQAGRKNARGARERIVGIEPGGQ